MWMNVRLCGSGGLDLRLTNWWQRPPSLPSEAGTAWVRCWTSDPVAPQVEDSPDFRQEISWILRANFPSIDIIEAGDGEEVWRKIDGFHPNLVLMDLKLPGVDGLRLTKEIKARYSNLTVVILSSHDLPEYRLAALAYGASSYIAKGSGSIDELLTLIKDSLHWEWTDKPRDSLKY